MMHTAKADCKDEKIARHVQGVLDDHILVEETSRSENVVEFSVPDTSDYQRVISSAQLRTLPILWGE